MRISETQNLTVVLRVRPLNEPHVGKDRIVHILDGQMVILTDPRDEDDILRAKRSREKRYMFDIAFDSYITQLDVYLATTKPLIDSVLEGINATVFAYGPTGTGKTYTMLGTSDNPGIMALALNELFALIRKGGENSTFTVTMSYLEVYNELIRDLLCPETGDLELREDSSGVTVAGLSEVIACSTHEVMGMLRDGNKRRTTEPTSVNKTSSRSHAVLQVTVKRLKRVRSLTETVHVGKLYMIDLAGSERATHTKNRGTRLVEGAHINRSLLALGNCIKALSNNTSSYVNYRDSKLTRLLKDSLGGNCRTVMIAHVSPDWSMFDESRNTLQYADRAKRIKTKVRPNLHTVSHHIAKYPIIVEELHKEIARLKKEMSDSQSMETTSGVITRKERESMELKRADLIRIYNKQLKFKARLAKVEGSRKIGHVKVEHLHCLLEQYNMNSAVYSVLPAIQSVSAIQSENTENREIEIRTTLRHMSAGKKRADNVHTRLVSSFNKLSDKYRAIEETVEEKVCDEEHREILGMLSNVHQLELQLAGKEQETKCLNTILEEQGGWIKLQLSLNTELMQLVRAQHQLIARHNVSLTPDILALYRGIQERTTSEYSVLPRINSAVSSVADDTRSVGTLSPDPTPAAVGSTPIFMKTYNVVDKGEGAGSMERDMSQTTIHVLSTPSLTGDHSPQSPISGVKEGGSLSSLTLPKGSSSTELITPNTAQSSQIPGKQAKKAIQLQRLRTLRTEPVMKTTPSKKGRNKTVNSRTYSKNAFAKSETNLKIAQKTKIYGNKTRTPQTRDPKKQPVKKQHGNVQLSVAGTNKNFPVKIFR